MKLGEMNVDAPNALTMIAILKEFFKNVNTPATSRVERTLNLWSRWAPYGIFRLFRTSGTCTPKPAEGPQFFLVGSRDIFQSRTQQGYILVILL
jgi:hypothetical protein